MSCKAYFDGSCFLNYCAIGYVIRDRDGFPVCRASEFAGRGDALKAEYLALVAVVERLTFLRINEATIHGDSRTVICQVNGQMNTRNSNRFLELIMRLRRFFLENPGWRLKWIPRQENGQADALATEGLNGVKRSKWNRLRPSSDPEQSLWSSA
ncbi:MAG: ribonuclease HI family protein [Desulfomonile tiedjei]|uniref:Ribonuclease HI family protein n=1 Tax=Desulfomonile tiedjei TaxID=2358 RepID=A0A9D6Z1S7_9BACT|nr:ribonuclease HI family protein [Desulfomonile tiedjei]